MRFLRRSASPARFIRDERLAVDRAFLEWLAFGYTCDELVVEADIRDAEAAVDTWRHDDNGLFETLEEDGKHDYLDALLTSVVRAAVDQGPGGDPALVSLSGGYDSRAIAAAWPTERVHAMNYGRPGALDFDMTRAVARTAPLDMRQFDVRDLVWDRDEVVRELLPQRSRQLSPRVVVQPVLDRDLGRYVLAHGYLNDTLTGFRIATTEPWEDELAKHARQADRFRFQSALGSAVVRSLMPTDPWSDRLPRSVQLALLRNRCRIEPLSTPRRLMALPFADSRWKGFWLARTGDERGGQRLWTTFLSRKYPEWFPELVGIDASTTAREARARWLAERAEPLAPDDPGPLRPFAEHCWQSSYRDNRSFRDLVDDCVARIRSSRVFEDRFIDRVLDQWRLGTNEGRQGLKGLVTTELCLAGGAFDT